MALRKGQPPIEPSVQLHSNWIQAIQLSTISKLTKFTPSPATNCARGLYSSRLKVPSHPGTGDPMILNHGLMGWSPKKCPWMSLDSPCWSPSGPNRKLYITRKSMRTSQRISNNLQQAETCDGDLIEAAWFPTVRITSSITNIWSKQLEHLWQLGSAVVFWYRETNCLVMVN